MKKWIEVNYRLCSPGQCNGGGGVCKATRACPRDLLEQYESGDMPALLYREGCRGCGDCIRACPLKAIKMSD